MRREGLRQWPTGVRGLADRPVLAPLSVALFAAGLSVMAAWFSGMPVPRVHDEFSYLLAADTFAHGRLTNPAHPFWKHFDTPHVLQRPTYQSMYPPAQGLVLALGQKLGHPVLGVWLSVGAMAAAFCWMFRGWLPARWAWLGAMLAAARLAVLGREYADGVVGYWSQSYWGGAVAALGGALVYGALPRLNRGGRNGWLFGLGLAILAASRPFEGGIAALPALAVAGWRARRDGVVRRALIPAAGLVVMTAAAMVYYNHRVTGNAFTMPFVEHHRQYCTFPVFLWQTPRPAPGWTHPLLEEFHNGWEMSLYTRHFPGANLLRQTALKAARLWAFFAGPALTLPLLFSLRRGRQGLAPLVCGIVLAACLLCVRSAPHYYAPAAAPLFLLVTAGLRRIHRGSRAGAGLALLIFAAAGIEAAAALWQPGRGSTRPSRFMAYRDQLEQSLTRSGGRHLVLVSYGPRHSIHNEWVYNLANIDAATVVWARALREAEDASLRNYFKDRSAWRLEINDDSAPPSPSPWTP